MLHGEGQLDQAALERLYTRLEQPVFNVVLRRLWDAEDAREIVQEAFVRVWRMRDRVRLETVDPLVYRIALNLASRRRRWKRIRTWLSLDDQTWPDEDDEGVDSALDRHTRRRAVRHAVDALPDDLAQVVMLCAFSELTYDQVGDALGIPAGTVGSRRNKALVLLREQLGSMNVAL